MCKILGVSRSGYYKFIKSLNNEKRSKTNELVSKIKDIYIKSKGRYGAPRIYHQLRNEGIKCNHNKDPILH